MDHGTPALTGDLDTMRDKFNRELRERDYYPQSPSPGDCYVFDVVLGVDPRLLPVNQVISSKTYKTVVLDPSGRAERSPDGEVRLVTRQFTTQQRKALKEWWPLLSDRIRGFADEF